jgi:uncharacterized protein (TIGR02246 family)
MRPILAPAAVAFVPGAIEWERSASVEVGGPMTTARDEADIRQLIESWANAVRKRDVNGILRNHAPDILMFDVPPPLQSKGIDAYRATWDLFFSWARDPAVFDIKEMTITAGDDVAFAAALMRCAGTEPSGENIELDFRLTIGLRKINGQWTITHEHHSIPAVD